MALTKCTECKKDISKKAKLCPSCGAPMKQKTSGCAMLVAALLLFFVGVGIWGAMSEPLPQKTEKQTPDSKAQRLPNYSIISDTNLSTIKRSVAVRLEERLSEAAISDIAEDIKRSDPKNFQRTFIVYYLPDGEVGSGGWATSHFNPDLKVEIYGSKTQITPIIEEDEGSDVVGRWGHSTFLGGVAYAIIRTADGFLLRTTYKDGSTSEESVEAKREGTQIIVRPKQPNAWGEYWIVNDKKGLLVMDSEGLIETARELPAE